MMDTLVMGLDRDVVDDLAVVGDGEAMGAAGGMGEEAVVVAAAATEARSVTSEGEARDEDEVERGDFDGRTVRLGFPDVHLAALEIIERADFARLQFRGFNLKEAGAMSLRPKSRKKVREEVGLVFEAAEEGDDLRGGGFGSLTHAATKDVLGDLGAGLLACGFVDGTETLAHVLAERGFVVHAICSLFRVRGSRFDGTNARNEKNGTQAGGLRYSSSGF